MESEMRWQRIEYADGEVTRTVYADDGQWASRSDVEKIVEANARLEAERDEALAELDELYQAAVEVVYHAKSAKADEGLEITGASRLDLAMKAYENRFRERLTTNQEERDA